MQKSLVDLDETGCFSSFFLDYLSGSESLKPFFRLSPRIESFEAAIRERHFPPERRKTLVSTLQSQYQSLTLSSKLQDNLQKLGDEKTFTITTGHQLNLFTGPLYFIYKITSVIKTAEALKARYPDYHFVPVYWMASEDHDFDEINHFHLFGQNSYWLTEQTGAVGRINPQELEALLKEIPGDTSIFDKAYLENTTLSSACRQYVNDLFGEQGLVVLDADDKALKEVFKPVAESDLFDQAPRQKIDEQSRALQKAGYKTQINSREINLFYLKDDLRSRIEKTGEGYQVVDTEITFTQELLKNELEDHPEHFSPNVALRPVYQEMILPNLAYVGGPSEIVYWLQLQSLFDFFHVPFPILMPRHFGLIFPPHLQKIWEKHGLSDEDLFHDMPQLEAQWMKKHKELEFSFEEPLSVIHQQYDKLKAKAVAIDPTLQQHLEALEATATGKIRKAEKKLIRAGKKKHDDSLRQIRKVKSGLFPDGNLQERKWNFLNFYLDDPAFIEKLLDVFEPFQYDMHILRP